MSRNCVLFVENDPAVIRAFFEAFECVVPIYAVQIVASGAEVISYLNGIGKYSQRDEYPTPSVVVVGSSEEDFSAVEWMRSQPDWAWMRVVALVDSEDEPTIKRAYEAGANSCLVRTGDFTELREILGLVGKYWIDCNHVPGVA